MDMVSRSGAKRYHISGGNIVRQEKILRGRAVAVLSLTREYGPTGTNGTLTLRNAVICHTIELPWRNNRQRISCIPEGRYRLVRQQYHRHGEQLGLIHVPQREAILIHAGNDAQGDLQGCIAPVTTLTGVGRGIHSQQALQKLKDVVYPLIDQGMKIWLVVNGNQSAVVM